MEYISQILKFNELLLTNNLAPGQIALWYALMHINNKCQWSKWFTAAIRTLELYTGLSKNGVIKARNVLKQKGLIDFTSNGTAAASFHIKILYSGTDSGTDSSTDSGTDSGTDGGTDSGTDSGTDGGTDSGLLTRQRLRLDKDKDYKKEKDKKEKEPPTDPPNAKKKNARPQGGYDRILSDIEDEELKNLYYEYIKMRKLIKAPMTDYMLRLLINKVNTLEPDNVERQKQLLKNSMVKGWKSVYPLKDADDRKMNGKGGDDGGRTDEVYGNLGTYL